MELNFINRIRDQSTYDNPILILCFLLNQSIFIKTQVIFCLIYVPYSLNFEQQEVL